MDYQMHDREYGEYHYKKKKHRRNYSLVFLSIFIILAAIFVILSLTILFPIKTVIITGSSVYSASDIKNTADIKDGQQIITLKSDNIETAILEKFIYIDETKVKKRFPETVEIEVIPSTPAASIAVADGYLYLSASGKILELNPLPKKDAPVFTGVTLSEAVVPGVTIDTAADTEDMTDEEKADLSAVALVLEVSADLPENVREKTDYIDVRDRGDIKIMYDNRLELGIGGLSDFEYKLGFLTKIIEDKIGPNTSGKLTMLSTGGASFIDSDGLKYNERKFEANKALMTAVTDETSETSSVSDSS
ncbi:MAG: FtsQ-type POTRA domain-containing protein [Ruminococcus sp.]|jgi:cell division septal protein FtsQ|nr:FtsQ-type POTRA domain-containing protein [Ruminococcus sp.]